jgi:hypothetical protein
MHTPSLYQISEEYLNLQNQLEENEGEITPELQIALEINAQNFIAKSINYAKLLNKITSEFNRAAEEIERLQEYLETKKKAHDILEERLLFGLKLFGNKDPQKDIWRLEAGTYKFNTRKSISTNIINEETVPAKFKTFSYTVDNEVSARITAILPEVPFKAVPSKTAIKKAIQEGETVPGAELKENYTISIK